MSYSPSAAEVTGHSEDLVTQISFNLPVKSILRFRSVSKKWHSLLTHPRFIKRYVSHTKRNSVLLLKRTSGDFDSLHLNGNDHNLDSSDFGYLRNPNDHGHLFLVQSCNGLLLFYSLYAWGEVPPRFNRRFYVNNPFTKKCCELAIPDYIATTQGVLSSYLSFDSRTSPYYKVIFIWSDNLFSGDFHISIYSSETQTCKNFDYTFEYHHPCVHSYSGAYFNGAIYWLNFDYNTSSYFDIKQESIKNVPLNPPCSSPGRDLKYFGGYGDHVHLIVGDETDHVLDVYELKEDYSTWVAKYKVDIESIAVGFPEIIISRDNEESEKRYKYSLLSVLEKEEEATIVLYAGNHLLAYNLIDKTTKKLNYVPPHSNGSDPYNMYKTYHCVESLFDV